MSNWRSENRNLLSECGIPDLVANSDRVWNYVLLHGDDLLQTGWTPAWISPKQASQLLAALERGLPNEDGCDLLRALRRRLVDPE
jgi:hypothetical protein